MKRDLNADIREAFRQKDLMCRKIAVRKSLKAEHVRMCSHTVVAIGDVTFYDMAVIDALTHPTASKHISKDFSGMTNTILSTSAFYKGHEILSGKQSELG